MVGAIGYRRCCFFSVEINWIVKMSHDGIGYRAVRCDLQLQGELYSQIHITFVFFLLSNPEEKSSRVRKSPTRNKSINQ